MNIETIVLDDSPCACCERNPLGCTDGPTGLCCPCCSNTGREFYPYDNQEAARVFAGATLTMAQALESTDPRRAASLRASVHVHLEVDGKSVDNTGMREEVECDECKRPEGAVNHVRGFMFVGWGMGWQPCSKCHGTGRVVKR